jgi:hypothetical protein
MAKTKVDNYVFRPGISYLGNKYLAAYSALENNTQFLKAEAVAYINSRITTDTNASLYPNGSTLFYENIDFLTLETLLYIEDRKDAGAPGFNGYTYNQDKCERDIGYVLNAIYKDLRWGGNWNTRYIASFYWIGDQPQIDGDRQAEVLTYQWLEGIVNNNIMTGTPFTTYQDPSDSTYETQYNAVAPAEAGIASRITELFSIIYNVIDNGLTDLPDEVLSTYPFANYTYNQPKCERDVGYVIEAYLYDLRYGGNEKMRYVARHYWENTTSQLDGDRQPETQTHRYLSDVIQDFIITNTEYANKLNTTEDQVIDQTDFVSGTAEIIEADTQLLINVIRNGLSSMPALVEAGYSKVSFAGNYDATDILLITNTTANTVIYNFSANTLGGTVTKETYGDIFSDVPNEQFSTFLQKTDSVTEVHLTADTSNADSTDDIQIFVEFTENGKSITTTRPHDFGTDAIERMRVAPPLSMLDADFEYGLQPTKWSAIATQRGYPSIYEIPGTELSVDTVTSDASVTTDNIGSSIITVTTLGTHGLEGGQPITVLGLDQSVNGYARAEGSFVVITVPTGNSFTYYAKGKVGTTSGDRIETGFTQIREGGFYTGASIGQPSLAVVSQGTSGNITTQFRTSPGTSRIAFTGIAPEIGAPIIGPGIPSGAQITGVVGSGGIVVSPGLIGTYPPGTTTVTVSNPLGVVPNLGLDDGSGNLILVEDINSSVIDLSDPTTGTLVGDVQTYTGVTGTNVVGSGSEATFNVTRGSSNAYEQVEVDSGGFDYVVGDTIKISGSDIGGTSPLNDLYVTVAGADDGSTSNVISVLWRGEAVPIPPQTIIGINDTVYSSNGTGAGATFDIQRGSTDYTVTVNNAGSGFINGEIITVPGNIFNNSTSPANDVTITVTEIADEYQNVPQSSTSGSGSGALWDIEKEGTTYTQVNQALLADSTIGDGYALNDTITLSGTDLGASSPANDLTITITEVAKVYSDLPASGSASGTLATFGLVKLGTGYSSLVIVDSGDGYIVGETLTISGSDLDGTPVTNDATFTTTQIEKQYTNLTQSSTTGSGLGATFNVTKTVDGAGGTYSVVVSSGGSGYNGGDEIRILGTSLDGLSPANDLVMTVDSHDGSGQLFTVIATGTAGGSGGVIQVSNLSGTAGGTGFISAYTFAGTAGGTGRIFTFNSSGTANGSEIFSNVPGINVATQGNGASFQVVRQAGVYTAGIEGGSEGTLYQPGNRILVAGNTLDGTTPANDLIITINSIGGAGEIVTVTASGTPVSGATFDLYSTILISENTSTDIPTATTLTYEALATLEASFGNPHGIVPGGNFIVNINTDDGSNNHNLAAGSFSATNVPSLSTLRFNARAPGNIDTSVNDIAGEIYTRPDSFFVHRPFDGGVQLGTGGPQYGAQAIRQSKKYIRYQSGKGIMYTTGALFAPSYDILSIDADGIEVGSTITVELGDNDHGLQPGCEVRIIGCETDGYNGEFYVDDVVTERKFTYIATRRLGSKTATLSPECQVSTLRWTGSIVRAGIFDDQNGIFWEYDGQQTAVVQRTATKQIAGTISIEPDSNQLIGNRTRFRDQLKAGDRIVIKGMTHVVSNINSQTLAYVAPDFRGVASVAGAKASLVQDKRVRQEHFNLDKLDGTGPSGYNLDITKMQMIGIQYSWYGAGFIDYMVRGADGNFVFCHRIRNSNVNTEAYMRSGNLPVRYEVTNEGPVSRLVADVDNTQTFIELDTVEGYPDEGTVYVDNEIMKYSAVDLAQKRLTGITRGTTYNLFAQGADRVYSGGSTATHETRTGVILLTNTTTPLISHWGSAFITDGMFDEDRGYIFSYAATGIDITAVRRTAFLIRLAPSVSNAVTGNLGERELLNRAQLLLQGIEITSDSIAGGGGIIVEGVLNPQNYPTNVASVSWSGLATPSQGGQPSFAQIAPGGSIDWGATTSTTTAAISGNITTGFVYSVYLNNERNNPLTISTSSFNAAGPILVGSTIQSQNPNNAYTNRTYTVVDVQTNASFGQVDVYYDNNRSNATQNTATTIQFTYNTYTGRTSRLLFSEAAWLGSGATIGTPVSTGDTNWPAGTAVSTVEKLTLGSTTFYEVSFNQTSVQNLNPGDNVTFEFGEAGYAEPGETVFKFIAVPGERSQLDLSQLKELTNTTLGGRGTFPNGPDVLAINIYKATGADTAGNIVLKWGEAQA